MCSSPAMFMGGVCTQPAGKKHGVEFLLQIGQCNVAAEFDIQPKSHAHAADSFDFLQCDRHRLSQPHDAVGGNPPAGHAFRRSSPSVRAWQFSGTGKSGGSGADDGNFVCPWAARVPEQLSFCPQSNPWRNAASRPIMMGLCSAPRTQAPSQSSWTGHTRAQVAPSRFDSRIVCAEPVHVTGRDLLNEARNVDVRRTSVSAGRVVAVQAAMRFNQRLVVDQRRQFFRRADRTQSPDYQLSQAGEHLISREHGG